ncbi:MAG: class I SAM-dependent methyltransferase [Gemmatimonadota bacterium]
MWFAVLFDRRPKRLLEIGVYRGQILSLWALIARELGYSTEVVGVSPFSSVGDRVSVYKSIDYQKDVLQHFAHWNLSSPTLHRTLSTAPAAVDLIRGGEWDIVYVDGNHDYDVVREDLKNAVAGLRPGGIVVADDAALRLKYSPPPFAFQGHPGPSDGVRDLSEEGVVKLVTFVGHNVILSKK